MTWLPIYAAEDDLPLLLDFLNACDEIAFIVSRGPGKWIAVKSLDALTDGRYCLWHVPSGALPLFRGANEAPEIVANAFQGWSERKAGADPSQPYFGPGHPGVLWLNVRVAETHRVSGKPLLGLSSFEWIGNYYKMIGVGAKPQTERFWKQLRRWVQKYAVKVPRGGPQNSTPPEIWAFPSAQSRFAAGMEAACN